MSAQPHNFQPGSEGAQAQIPGQIAEGQSAQQEPEEHQEAVNFYQSPAEGQPEVEIAAPGSVSIQIQPEEQVEGQLDGQVPQAQNQGASEPSVAAQPQQQGSVMQSQEVVIQISEGTPQPQDLGSLPNDTKLVYEADNTTFHSDPTDPKEMNGSTTNGGTPPKLKAPVSDKSAQQGYDAAPPKPMYRAAPLTVVYVAPGAGSYVQGTPVFIDRSSSLIKIAYDQNGNEIKQAYEEKVNGDQLPANALIDVANNSPILRWDGTQALDSKGLPAVVTKDVFAYPMPNKQQLVTYYVPANQQAAVNQSNQKTDIDWLDFWFGCNYVSYGHTCGSCYRPSCRGYCGYYNNHHYKRHHHWHTSHHHHHHYYGCDRSLFDIVFGVDHHHHGHGHSGIGHIGHGSHGHHHARQDGNCLTRCCSVIYNLFKSICSGLYKCVKCTCGNCSECLTSKDGCCDATANLCGQCGKACCSCLEKIPDCLSACAEGLGKVCGELAKVCGKCGNACCSCVVEAVPNCLTFCFNGIGKLCGQCGSGCCDCLTKCVQSMPDCRLEDAGKLCEAVCSICGALGQCCCVVLEGCAKLGGR